MTNKSKRTLLARYLATPVDVLEECIAEIYTKRRGDELFQGEKPRSYDTIGWDLFLKTSQLDNFVRLYEMEKKFPGVIQEMIETAEMKTFIYEEALELFETWLLPSFGIWGRVKVHHIPQFQGHDIPHLFCELRE